MRVNKIVSPRQATGQLSDSAGGGPSVNDCIVWKAVSNDNSGSSVKKKIHLPMLSFRSVNMVPMGAYVDLYRDFSGPLVSETLASTQQTDFNYSDLENFASVGHRMELEDGFSLSDPRKSIHLELMISKGLNRPLVQKNSIQGCAENDWTNFRQNRPYSSFSNSSNRDRTTSLLVSSISPARNISSRIA